jgi:hypothetical protein
MLAGFKDDYLTLETSCMAFLEFIYRGHPLLKGFIEEGTHPPMEET